MKRLLCAALALMSTNVFAQNLVAHFDFEPQNVNLPGGTGSGTVTDNVNGWVGNMTNISNYFPTSGSTDWGIMFGGNPSSGSYVQVPYDPAMDLESWTIVARVRVTDCNPFLNSQWCQTGAVVWKGAAGSSDHYSLVFSDNPADNNCNQQTCHQSVYKAAGAGQQMANGTSYNDAIWLGSPGNPPNPFLVGANATGLFHCVVSTYDHNTQTLRLYIDGTLHVSTQWDNQFSPPPPSGSGDLFFGNTTLGISAYGQQFVGSLADVKIYDAALSPADVRQACGCQSPNLIAHWDFNNGNTTELINGWNNNAAHPNFNPPAQQIAGMDGAPNGAMKFNQGEFLSYVHDPIMDLTSWTIVAKVRPDNFNSAKCQVSSIVWKGTQWGANPFCMHIFDNPSDNNNCDSVKPDSFVFAGFPAGIPNAPITDWLGGPSKNLPPNPYINWGQWYCAILSYDANTSEVKVYIDGVLVAIVPWSNQYGSPMPAGDLFIGSSNTPSPAAIYPYFFDGAMDDIKIYDGIFCPGEVQNLCCGPITPVARWNFANGNTKEQINNWTDMQGTTLTKVAGYDGTANEAVHFNRGQFLQFPHDPKMDLTSWTITAIVRPTSWDPNQICQVTSVLQKGTQYSNNCMAIHMFDNAFDQNCYRWSTNNNVFAGLAAGTSSAPVSYWLGGSSNPNGPLATNPFVNLNQWYCAAITYDANTGRLMAYVDGQHVATIPQSNQYGNPMSPADLFIGSSDNPYGLYPYFFEGDIDEIRIYSGVLCHSKLPNCDQLDRTQFKSTKITNVLDGNIEIIPNPANDVVNITIPHGWTDVPYTLTNSVGMTIQSGSLNGKTTLDVSNLASGIYMITTKYNGQSSVQKLVIQH